MEPIDLETFRSDIEAMLKKQNFYTGGESGQSFIAWAVARHIERSGIVLMKPARPARPRRRMTDHDASI